MPTQERQAYCVVCGRLQLARRSSVNHFLHFFLTIITLGFWSIVWFLAAYAAEPWHCAVCGSPIHRELQASRHAMRRGLAGPAS